MPPRSRPIIGNRPLLGNRPIIGGARNNASSNFNVHGANEISNKVITLDVLYFQPAEDVERVSLSEVLGENEDVFKEMADVVSAAERERPIESFAQEMLDVFNAVTLNHRKRIGVVQRFVVSGQEDLAELPDSDIARVTQRINDIGDEFHRIRFTARHPQYYHRLMSKVVETSFDCKRGRRTIQLNFIAAHAMERDPMGMIREVPFAGARLFLQNWMFTHHAPMAIARVGFSERLLENEPGLVRGPASTLRH